MDPITQVILPKCQGIRPSAGSWMVCCPAHDDGKASLHISRGTEQPAVFFCHAGCQTDDILAALGLSWADLCEPREEPGCGEWTPYGPALAVYDYTDENGKLLFQVCRTPDKKFPQRVPDPSRKSGWHWKIGATRLVPYRLPKILAAIPDGHMIFVAEGEKDVHALEAAGEVATCNPGGAGKWRDEYSEHLRDAIVVVIADKDDPGQAHARRVARSLDGIAAAVEVREAADPHKDAADHLGAGLTVADFVTTSRDGEQAAPDLAPDLYDFLAIEFPPDNWLIPEILERGDRLIWTGFEGLGKSVMVRQLAVAAAAGVHPFTGDPIDPVRVLFIDCENPDRKSQRHFARLEKIARLQGFPVPKNGLRIIQRPAGVDLTRDEHAAWLVERVTIHGPDLFIVGPFYRLHAVDTNDEQAARLVVGVLDQARLASDCALVTEAHSGHGEGGSSRSIRPTGSSLLLRWPEFGYGMKPEGEADEYGHHHQAVIAPWRGPREERHWPREVMWGTRENDWPWVPAKGRQTPGLRSVAEAS